MAGRSRDPLILTTFGVVFGDDRRFQAALFDMDGLLVDSEPLWRDVEMTVFGRLGVALTTELCLETRGMVLDEVTEYWFGRYPWERPPPGVVATEIVDAMVGLVPTRLVLKPGALHAGTGPMTGCGRDSGPVSPDREFHRQRADRWRWCSRGSSRRSARG